MNQELQSTIAALDAAPEGDKVKVAESLAALQEQVEGNPLTEAADKQALSDALKRNLGKLHQHVEERQIIELASSQLDIAAVDALRSQLASLQEEVGGFAETVGDITENVVEFTTAAASTTVDVTTDVVKRATQGATDTYRYVSDAFKEAHKNHPTAAKVALAGGVGLLILGAVKLKNFIYGKVDDDGKKVEPGFFRKSLRFLGFGALAAGVLSLSGMAVNAAEGSEQETKDTEEAKKKLDQLNAANQPVDIADTEGIDIFALQPPVIIGGKEVQVYHTTERTVFKIDGVQYQLVGREKTVGSTFGFGGRKQIVEGEGFEGDRKKLQSLRGGKDKVTMGLSGIISVDADITHAALSSVVQALSSSPEGSDSIDVPLTYDTKLERGTATTLLRFKRIADAPAENSEQAA